ncbi:uncharacterized protein LY89DRAFT_688724 [Mollisia scopiformis]|uniref:Uncharacterized protein n=1 Tax=Mollisia scopiformis TaxID=149040 RepID=A0A194WU51_MOLSC|nr:uncharacterized protein LY89DRAFT_688724 [Mollisia scopiformis]KUJ11483.1 hypothetical protein LY89DRAFT_688724 [Mollisia scopiformis]
MIFGGRRTNTDINPSPFVRCIPPWQIPCSISRTSCLHFLRLPSEIRRLVFYHYLLSLNLPDHFFHHLTFLGYWGSSSEPDSTQKDARGFDLGRKIKWEIECLFLINRQVHIEAEDVLYNSFIFYVHPRHQTRHFRQALYARKELGWKIPRAPRLPERVQNIQINLAFGQSISSLHWASQQGWRGSWLHLAAEFPHLRKVGLAVDYDPRNGDEALSKQLMDMVLCFMRIFQPTCIVQVRFAGVKYDSYARLSPASGPLYTDIIDEEKKLLQLRDESKLIWHKVARHFNDPRSELYSVAGLQARYQRLKLRQIQAAMEVGFFERMKEELTRSLLE